MRQLGIHIFENRKISTTRLKQRPGQHFKAQFRKSNYLLQLKAKQAIRYFYGCINEAQFKNIFKKAQAYKTNVAEVAASLLERRLDCFVWRVGLAKSIFHSQQIINHKKVLVNGSFVNIKSYVLKENDVVSCTTNSPTSSTLPSYIQKVEAGFVLSNNLIPFSEIKYPFAPNFSLVLAFYS